MIALYIIITVILLLVILSLIKISVHFSLDFDDKLEGLELKVQYLFIKLTILPTAPKKQTVKKKNESSETKNQENIKQEKTHTVKMIYYLVRNLKDDILKLLNFVLVKTVKVENFTLEARIGTDDPMVTGMAIGSANGFIYNLLALLDRHKLLKQFSVSIVPDWNTKIIKSGLYIKVYTRISTVLHLALIAARIGLKALWLMKKFKKSHSTKGNNYEQQS